MTFAPATLNRELNQDAFSKVLDMLRLRGTSVRVGELSGSEGLEFSDDAPCLYVVHEGVLRLALPKSNQTLEARDGDVLLLVRGDSHRVSCSAQIARSASGSAQQSMQYLRGEFDFDSIFANRFLAVLPSVILLRRPEPKRYEWVDLCFSFIVDEAVHGLAGSTAMISRLLDLLFVRTLRIWASESRLGYGWVTGGVDPRIGKVLAAIHQDPARVWNLPGLADLANMSRTAFTQRFTLIVGQSPIAYLNEWRLDHATDLLRRHKLSMSELLLQTGYTSPAAFGRAFKARHGLSPMQWRSAVALPSN
jgi:AraC-like DNA-binding protein